MDTKTKSPLWIIAIEVAFYITKGSMLIFTKCLNGIPAFGLMFVFDLIIIISAMVPQATADECKNNEKNVLPFATALSIPFSIINGFLLVLATKYSWDSIEEMNKFDNVVNMHALFAGLFMTFVYIKQLLLPIIRYH